MEEMELLTSLNLVLAQDYRPQTSCPQLDREFIGEECPQVFKDNIIHIELLVFDSVTFEVPYNLNNIILYKIKKIII